MPRGMKRPIVPVRGDGDATEFYFHRYAPYSGGYTSPEKIWAKDDYPYTPWHIGTGIEWQTNLFAYPAYLNWKPANQVIYPYSQYLDGTAVMTFYDSDGTTEQRHVEWTITGNAIYQGTYPIYWSSETLKIGEPVLFDPTGGKCFTDVYAVGFKINWNVAPITDGTGGQAVFEYEWWWLLYDANPTLEDSEAFT